MERPDGQSGQASVELVAVLPFIALVAMVLWQAAVAGQAAWVAGSAARAAARAHAIGRDPLSAARSRLPERLEQGLRVRTGDEGSVGVVVGVPLVTSSRRLTTITASAAFQAQTP